MIENMNEVNDKENRNNDVEEMDTQEVKKNWYYLRQYM
jgi:hypothetical protein